MYHNFITAQRQFDARVDEITADCEFSNLALATNQLHAKMYRLLGEEYWTHLSAALLQIENKSNKRRQVLVVHIGHYHFRWNSTTNHVDSCGWNMTIQ